MNDVTRQFRDFFVSLRLTVVLLSLSIILIFWATIAQVDLGIWEVQKKFFQTFIVLGHIGSVPVPVFPGGYFIGGLLFINLISAHVYRFKFTWRKAGIFLTHVGLILLLVGELFTGFWQQVGNMQIAEGQTVAYAEDERQFELAITDTTDPAFDEVVAIPERALTRGDPVQHAKLPFRVAARAYYPNAIVQERRPDSKMPPSLATMGGGTKLDVFPIPMTARPNEVNIPAAYVDLLDGSGALGTWLVDGQHEPQSFSYGNREWKIALRRVRRYEPFALTLLELRHDVYPGTDIPKNFSSRVHLKTSDGRDDREVLIRMNEPLRYSGLTFFQSQMNKVAGYSVLQVVRNPSWQLPYVACALMTLGLLSQFGIHLTGFVRRRA